MGLAAQRHEIEAFGAPKAVSAALYRKYKRHNPVSLVEEVLRVHAHSDPSAYFAGDTWALFKHAVEFRNLVVHECTYLGQDKYPSLIQAAEEVLAAMIRPGRLREPEHRVKPRGRCSS